MRKQLSLLVCIISSVFSFSQGTGHTVNMPRFMLSGGANISTVTSSESWTGGLVGLHVGAGVAIDPGQPNQFVATGQVSYDMMGSKYDESSYKGKVILSYINIPLMAQYRSTGGFFAEAGLQPGFLTSAKDKYDGNEDDVKEHVESFHFGIPFGIGYMIGNIVSINARYMLGVTKLDKEGDDKDKNSCFTIRLIFEPGGKK